MRRKTHTTSKRSKARSKMLIRLAMGVVAAIGVTTLPWPAADAQDATVAAQASRARQEGGRHRKAAAIERLCQADSSSARDAIKALADDSDDATALVAIGALCREDFRGARGKLQSIFEDDERSDLVRSAAIGACLDMRKRGDASWSQVRGYVTSHTDSDDAVRDMAMAVATRLWGTGVSDE